MTSDENSVKEVSDASPAKEKNDQKSTTENLVTDMLASKVKQVLAAPESTTSNEQKTEAQNESEMKTNVLNEISPVATLPVHVKKWGRRFGTIAENL